MKKVIIFFKSRPWSILILYWVIHQIWYLILNQYTHKMNYHVIQNDFDNCIPFLSVFVLPYSVWFFYIAVVSVYFMIHDKIAFIKTTISIHIGNFICMLICTVYPTVVNLRADVSDPKNIFERIVSLIYNSDEPAVVFPSMHVLVSILLFTGVLRSKILGKRTGIVIASGILSLSICLSTVFIKQHSILDLIAGTIVALIVYTVVYHFIKFKEKL